MQAPTRPAGAFVARPIAGTTDCYSGHCGQVSQDFSGHRPVCLAGPQEIIMKHRGVVLILTLRKDLRHGGTGKSIQAQKAVNP